MRLKISTRADAKCCARFAIITKILLRIVFFRDVILQVQQAFGSQDMRMRVCKREKQLVAYILFFFSFLFFFLFFFFFFSFFSFFFFFFFFTRARPFIGPGSTAALRLIVQP
jgi:hypothetical protein